MATIQTPIALGLLYTQRNQLSFPKQIIICLEYVISSTNMTLSLKVYSKDILTCKGVTNRKFVE